MDLLIIGSVILVVILLFITYCLMKSASDADDWYEEHYQKLLKEKEDNK